MRRVTILSFFLFVFISPYAQSPIDSVKVTGDSLHYLTETDTVFLSIGKYQEKVFSHFMAPKQTLYSLSRFYGLSLEELYFYNSHLMEEAISLGQEIIIPIPTKSIIRFQRDGFDAKKHVPIYYTIKKGDTVYNLAKRIFQMPIDTFMIRNQLTSFDLELGQKIHLGWMSIEGIPEANRRFRGHPLWKKNDALRRKYIQHRQVKKEHVQRGMAFWQKTENLDTELFALHRSAPVNSVIAVTNPMTKRTVYVKVIGKMPNSVYTENVTVVLSSTTAKMLGAKDTRFFVQVRYLK